LWWCSMRALARFFPLETLLLSLRLPVLGFVPAPMVVMLRRGLHPRRKVAATGRAPSHMCAFSAPPSLSLSIFWRFSSPAVVAGFAAPWNGSLCSAYCRDLFVRGFCTARGAVSPLAGGGGGSLSALPRTHSRPFGRETCRLFGRITWRVFGRKNACLASRNKETDVPESRRYHSQRRCNRPNCSLSAPLSPPLSPSCVNVYRAVAEELPGVQDPQRAAPAHAEEGEDAGPQDARGDARLSGGETGPGMWCDQRAHHGTTN